jgi:hypothetical protein
MYSDMQKTCIILSTSESRRKRKGLKIRGKPFAGLRSFKYLGNLVNNGNTNDNCVKERIQDEDRAYYANLKTLKSKI